MRDEQHYLTETLRGQVLRLERALHAGTALRDCIDEVHLPAWLRRTEGEQRIPVSVIIAGAIALQAVVPGRFALHPHWLLPALEAALVVALIAANPIRIDKESSLLRMGGLSLITMISAGNAISAVLLVRSLVTGHAGEDAGALLATGAAIWGTNVIAFALWYWELDRGGPAARACGRDPHPDFLFTQMTAPEVAPPDWEPNFLDYLYLSFTNATAFSPTDVMPLSRWAKMMMLLQSAVSIVAIALVISRAVNILR